VGVRDTHARHAALVGLLAGLAVASPQLAEAQAISFDDAISLSASTPAVAGEERALAARAEGDARISDITEASRLGVDLILTSARGASFPAWG
jgi:hypothetical protein